MTRHKAPSQPPAGANTVPLRRPEPADPAPDSFVIHTDLLIPGRGAPSKNASVVLQAGKITFVGPTKSLPSPFGKLPSTKVPVLMPGMWDCHTHLIGMKKFDFVPILTEAPVLHGMRLARSVQDILMSGFTSVRDLGGWGCEITPAIQEGIIAGPNIYSTGAALSQTAGHGDVFPLPIGWVYSRMGVSQPVHANGESAGVSPLLLCDGETECRRAVRLQIRRGAKCIKVFASGGVLSIQDDPMRQQFSDEELRVIVEEAERQGRIVAAHVHGKAGILAAIKAGCKTLEHGTYLDDETVELMLKHDVMLVATRTIVVEGVNHPELMDPASYAKMLETAKHHKQAYAMAIKAGVRIALGTDLGVSTPGQSLSLGRSGGELGHAVDAGMTVLEAIEAATANGPMTLGALGMAPMSGQVKEGYDADLIALTKSPLDENDGGQGVGIFKDVKNVTHVWKGGKLFKSPSMGG